MPEISEEEMNNMSAEQIAELQKQNCIFCKIASKEIPAKIIHEDEDIMCILDINPASEGHILVYPKKHYMILPHIPEDIIGKLFSVVKLMSNTLLKSLQCKGTSVFIANGQAAGQRAPHVIIHVFPRRENDGLLSLPKYEMNDEQIAKLKATLKPYMAQMFGAHKGKEEKHKEEKTSPEKKEHHAVIIEEDKKIHNEKTSEKNHEETSSKKTSKKEPIESSKEKLKTKTPALGATKKPSLDDISRLFGV